MLRLDHIQLVQFRNYSSVSLAFTDRIVGICGANGTGKTNLLDAIHYLCLTKSFFSRPDSQSVSHGKQGLRIEGSLRLDEQRFKLVCILRETNRKEFLVNDIPYKKFSEHIGRFPCVMIAPDDVEIITGGSEARRGFIDAILCQSDREYLQELIAYNKLLQQRNGFLKQTAESNLALDESLLEVLNEQLSARGGSIHRKRTAFMRDFLPMVIHHYQKIADKDDEITLEYQSQLHGAGMKELLKATLHKDLALQRTSAGIHKDELQANMNGLAFKSQASQGQRKSLLFALKLAEWSVLKDEKGFAPLLLLDDVFEKLDEHRMRNLLHWVCAENEGQVFITDTHKERLTSQLQEIKQSCQIIQLS